MEQYHLNSEKGNLELSGMETYEIMKTGLCFIPQDRSLFVDVSTVAENLAMAGYTINDKQDLRGRIDEALDTFPRLKERLTRKYAGNNVWWRATTINFCQSYHIKTKSNIN